MNNQEYKIKLFNAPDFPFFENTMSFKVMLALTLENIHF